MGQVVVLQVTGMDCGACERRLQTVLGRLDGVGQVDADHSIGQVRVRFDAARTNAAVLTRGQPNESSRPVSMSPVPRRRARRERG